MGAERYGLGIAIGELAIAERRVDRSMADRMDRNPLAPAAASRHRMMVFDSLAERAAAQEAPRRSA